MKKYPYLILLIAFVLSACNLPAATRKSPESTLTRVAQTIEAELTINALMTPIPTSPPASNTPNVNGTPSPIPASPSPTSICDLAQFVSDVTVPDGSVFLPDTTFTKTWRFRNIGTCTWTSAYHLVFDHGEIMSGISPQPLAGNVAPGQTVDISINLKSPSSANNYRGYWRLRNAAGVLIPIAGGDQGQTFFVDIKVSLPTATPTVTPTVGLFLPPIILVTLSP